MKKLYYIPYNNINEEEYLQLRTELIPIKSLMMQILSPLGWELSDKTNSNEYLIIDFIKDESIFRDNLGVKFNGENKEKLFSFYILRAFDEDDVRFYIRERLLDNKSIDLIAGQVEELINSAALIFNKKWTKEYIKGFGESLRL